MQEKLVLHEQKGRVAYLTLNRPEKRNSMSPKLIQELHDALDVCEKNSEIKTIVLRAAGKVFSAGADLTYLQQLQTFSFEENLQDSKNLKKLYQKIYLNSKVVIAQIEGHAIAGGCGLATVCDFVFSVPEAKFGYTESRIGFVPALVMVYLIRKIGEGRARPLLLHGDLIDAEKAKQLGIVYETVAAEAIEEHVYSFAEQINNSVSSQSVEITKETIAKVQDLGLEDGLNFASEINAKARANEDCKSGIQKFLNKEKINW